MILLLYIDDLFIIGIDGLIADTKRNLATEFEMKDLGMMHYFLGMEVWHNVDGIFLCGIMWTREVCIGALEEVRDDRL